MHKLEQQLLEHEMKQKELQIQNEALDVEIAALLAHCNVTEKQLTTYVSSPEYFTESQWETLAGEKKKIDQAFESKLACIPNLKEKQKKQKERSNVASHWLFVR